MDWFSINQVQHVCSLTKLLEKHSSVFEEELGSLLGKEVTIHVKGGIKTEVLQGTLRSLCPKSQGRGRVRLVTEGSSYSTGDLL